MSLEPDEALEAYDTLSAVLQKVKLGWLVSDVERQIALGKPARKKIEFPVVERHLDLEPPSEHDGKSKPKKSKSVVVVVAEEYSPNEQLMLLIDAFESVSVGFSKAVLKTMSFMDKKLGNFSALEFSEDRKGAEPRRLTKDFKAKKKQIDKLAALVGEIKGALQ